jgi:hypothetical protein
VTLTKGTLGSAIGWKDDFFISLWRPLMICKPYQCTNLMWINHFIYIFCGFISVHIRVSHRT